MKRRRGVGFAPSSGGCITCKQRKIRCDQSQPHCLKCIDAGRTCLGYRNPSVAFDIDTGNADTLQIVKAQANTAWLQSSKASQSWTIPKAPPPGYASLSLKEADRQAYEYFTNVFGDVLVSATPGIASIPVVLALSRDRSLLLHAASLIGTAYQASTKAMHTSLAAATSPAIKTNLSRQYSRTITGLHELINSANKGDDQLETILVCCLFLSILELVQGNNVQALRHLSFGRVIFMEYYPRILGLEEADRQHLTGSPLIALLLGTFFPFGCNPSMRKPTLAIGSNIPERYSFSGSIGEATNGLNALQEMQSLFIADLMDLAEEYRCSVAPVTAMLNDAKQFCLTQCVSRMSTLPVNQRIYNRLYELRQSHKEWLKACETLLIENARIPVAELLLLKIRWYTSHLQLEMCRDPSEMSSEHFSSDFLELLNLLEIYLARWKTQGNGPSDPRTPHHITHTRHPELGTLQALITICFKCRDPTIRHKALRLLISIKRQESLHDSDALAILVKCVIKLEEETVGVEWRFGSLVASEAPSQFVPEFVRFSEMVFDRMKTAEGAYKVFCARHRLESDGAIELWEFDYWADETRASGLRYGENALDAEIERSIKASTLRLCSRESFPSLVEPLWPTQIFELPSR